MKIYVSSILGIMAVFMMVAGSKKPAASIPKAYPANPLPAHTGGFGEKSCHSCHFDEVLNPEGGSLQMGWAHKGIRRGAEHRLKMTLEHAEMMRAGFQLTARFADGPNAGAQAGRFVPVATHQVLTEQGGIQYLSQTLQGGKLTKPGLVEWTVVWVAPAARRNVVFHLSAVVGNEDESQFGDWVYVKEFRPGIVN